MGLTKQQQMPELWELRQALETALSQIPNDYSVGYLSRQSMIKGYELVIQWIDQFFDEGNNKEEEDQIHTIECPQCGLDLQITKAAINIKCVCGLSIFLQKGVITKTDPVIKNCLTCHHHAHYKFDGVCADCYDIHTHVNINWIEKEGNT